MWPFGKPDDEGDGFRTELVLSWRGSRGPDLWTAARQVEQQVRLAQGPEASAERPRIDNPPNRYRVVWPGAVEDIVRRAVRAVEDSWNGAVVAVIQMEMDDAAIPAESEPKPEPEPEPPPPTGPTDEQLDEEAYRLAEAVLAGRRRRQ